MPACVRQGRQRRSANVQGSAASSPVLRPSLSLTYSSTLALQNGAAMPDGEAYSCAADCVFSMLYAQLELLQWWGCLCTLALSLCP